MRVIFLLLSVCSVLPAMAQRKLKVDIDKTTGDTIWTTTEQKLYVKAGRNAMGETLKVSLLKTSHVFVISFFVQTGRTTIFSVSKGSEVLLTLGDGTTVSLVATRDAESRSTASSYGSFLYTSYRLTPDVVAQLKSSPVTHVRISASVGPMKYEIKDKQSTIISNQLAQFDSR